MLFYGCCHALPLSYCRWYLWFFCIPADLTIWKSDNRQSLFCRCFLLLIAFLKACLVQKGWNIWLYGDIELHFSDNRLTQIRADFQPDAALSGGRWVKLNPWFFANGCLMYMPSFNAWYNAISILLKRKRIPIWFYSCKAGLNWFLKNVGVCNLPRSANKKPPCPIGHVKRLLK